MRMELYASPDGPGPRRRVGATRPRRRDDLEDAEPAEPAAQAAPAAPVRPPQPPAGPAGGMARGQARALMAQLAAEDARFSGPRR